MKKIIILFLCIGCFISCTGQANGQRQQQQIIPEIQQDTLVKLSGNWALFFLYYDEEMNLWHEPHIVNLNANDTIRIEGFSCDEDTKGSELFIEMSPNERYLVLDNIFKAYVDFFDGRGYRLRDTYRLTVIDIEKAKVVWILSTWWDLMGEWDEESNWVNERGEIVFPIDSEDLGE